MLLTSLATQKSTMFKSLALFSVFVFIFVLQIINGVPLSEDQMSKYFPRIVGGEEAAPGAAPHMAALVVGEYNMTMLVCGASIVSPQCLLTAAHCIDPFVMGNELISSYHAKVGTNDWSHKGTDARISNYHIHPRYDHQLIKYDVGVLKLEQPLTLSDRVAVIKLNYEWIGGGEEAYIMGWGRLQTGGITPFKLQMLSVNTLSPKKCAEDLLGSPVWGNHPPTLKADVEICAFHSEDRGLCHGDSGSALVLTSLHQQVGVASWAYPCARGLPDVYARLSGMGDFLQPILNESIEAVP